MKNRLFLGLLINVIALLQITSCTGKVSITPTLTRINIGDGGLISGIPCSAPCFNKIIPGETTKDEVKMIIKSQEWRCDTNDYPKINISSIKCERESFGINFEYTSNILQNIYFNPSISIRIDQVINKYGNPDLYLLLPTSVPEHQKLLLSLYFTKYLMEISFVEQNWPNFILSPDLLIYTVSYYNKRSYQELVDPSQLLSPEPWKGYGTY